MTESRRSLSRALRAAARNQSVEPEPGFVDRLEQRLRSLDIHAVPAPPSTVLAFRRRLTRGATIGVIAGLMTAAGAAAAAIVTVRHRTNPPPSTTVPPTTVHAVAPLETSSTISSAPTTVIMVIPEPSTAVTDAVATSATITIAATVTTPPTTTPPTTTPPTTTPPTVPPTTAPRTAPPTTIPLTTTPPTTAEPTPTTVAAVAVAPATDAPSTTEAHSGATMHLDCTAVGGGIQCTWGAVPDGTDHVVILRSTPAETRGRVLFPAAGASSMTDPTAVSGVTYTYLVHAEDSASHSVAHSNAVTVSCCG